MYYDTIMFGSYGIPYPPEAPVLLSLSLIYYENFKTNNRNIPVINRQSIQDFQESEAKREEYAKSIMDGERGIMLTSNTVVIVHAE